MTAFRAIASSIKLPALVLVSFFVVALGQPMRSEMLSMVASCLGFALFWYGVRGRKHVFWTAALWFGAVQAVQLWWLTDTTYMGLGILGVYGFLVVALGLQFGVLTWWIQRPLAWIQVLGAAGLWVWMEWMRLLPLTGFPWNPVGLSLAGNNWSVQFAALFGVYGLSFWVLLTNLAALKHRVAWAVLAITPYAFGLVHQMYWEHKALPTHNLSVALVQTGLRNEQKDYFRSHPEAFVSPFHQWEQILWNLRAEPKPDLIVLPEAALPFGSTREVYALETVRQVWDNCFGLGASDAISSETKKVSNSFWAQQVANRFDSEVVVGLDAADSTGKYNAAFHFLPAAKSGDRYEKRMLVPVGEYVPFQEWKFVSSFLAEQFGIEESFDVGQQAKVFSGKIPLGINICSEEIYGHLIRDVKQAGAQLLVNVTNDAWFPNTNLPELHFLHGRVRAAENGVGVVRACNTGVTGVIDRFGRVEAVLHGKTSGVLTVQLQPNTHITLYSLFGDTLICTFAAIFFLAALCLRKRLPEYRSVN